MKKLYIRLLGLSGVAGLLLAGVAHAQQVPDGGVYDTQDLQKVICNFAGYVFWIVLVVSVIMVLFAAYEYVTGGDDTEKTTKARKMITYAAIGIAVALMAGALPSIVGSIFPNPVDSNATTACPGVF